MVPGALFRFLAQNCIYIFLLNIYPSVLFLVSCAAFGSILVDPTGWALVWESVSGIGQQHCLGRSWVDVWHVSDVRTAEVSCSSLNNAAGYVCLFIFLRQKGVARRSYFP